MNRIAAVVAMTLLPTVLAGCSTMPSDPTAELLGQWSMVTRIGQGRMDATMTIDRAGDGTLYRSPGDVVEVAILRSGRELTLEVTLGTR